MARTMKAAVVHEFRKPLRVEEVPVPEPGPDQVLVKVEACGVCHTDLHAAEGDWPVRPIPPFIPVLNRKTIRGSIVGTRTDLIESLQFAAEGKVASHYSTDRLENINGIFDRMRAGKIEGRVVMEI